MYDDKSFSRDVISRWGALSEELIDHDGLLHPQMATLGRLCQNNIDACSAVLEFLGQVLQKEDAITEIENAVAISFLEWPELDQLRNSVSLPTNVAEVVRAQWDSGGNY